MYFTITSVRLKGPFSFFKLAGISSKVARQLKGSEGFVQHKSTGMWTEHYTMSLWKTEKDLMKSHLEAIRCYREVADEIKTLTLAADKFPDWQIAKDMLSRNGKVID
ncbi:MAG TPA: DUF3291 domain-containing protein [Cyclobacteriaceae bacterium]|nr:DUF3291 domain-containing protein [Cyclobacteriaceae bacterium]